SSRPSSTEPTAPPTFRTFASAAPGRSWRAALAPGPAARSVRRSWDHVLPLRSQIFGFGQERGEVADLGDVRHLVAGDQLANVEQGENSPSRVDYRPLPFGLAPAVEEVYGPPPNPGKVLQSLLQGPVELVIVSGVDGGAHVGRGQSVQMGVAERA